MLGACFAHTAIHDVKSFLWVLGHSIIKFLGPGRPPREMTPALRKVLSVFVGNYDMQEQRSKSWTMTSALLSSWSTSVQSLRSSRVLCMLGIMSSIWLIDTDLEWSSSTHIRHSFNVLSMLLRLCT